MRCFSYLRVSGKAQVEGDGFPRQRAAIEAWACINGAQIVREFVDEGVTGEADWDQRAGFEEMVGTLMINGVKTVVVENLTRLARAYVVQDSIITFLASRGYTLISADTGEDITEAVKGDPMKKAIIQMQAVFAELEKNSLVRKLRAARERRKAEGHRVEGRKPFGFFPGERKTLARMQELRAEGLGYYSVAKALNSEGLTARGGGAWYQGTVQRIMKRTGLKESRP